MAHAPEAPRGHSEDYFGRARDFWWNPDFVALMEQRLRWGRCRRVLEIGCGAGHWTRTYGRLLQSGASITGIDQDPKWATTSDAWAGGLRQAGLAWRPVHGDAQHLPFSDNSFDFVTCQTVLIHVADARRVLDEMVRVLEPGGLLLCVEPDNFANRFAKTSLTDREPLEAQLAEIGFWARIFRGRIARGLGDLSLGGRLPAMLSDAGLGEIAVCLRDKALPLYPPYAGAEQQAQIAALVEWYRSGADFKREEMEANYLAGGGDPGAFDAAWRQESARREALLAALRANKFDEAGGALVYLVSGRKPSDTAGSGQTANCGRVGSGQSR